MVGGLSKESLSKLGPVTEAPDRLVVDVDASGIKSAVKSLLDMCPDLHITSIVGVDRGEEIELQYHFFCIPERRLVTLRTKVPKAKAEVESISELIYGAILHENEVEELLGVVFKGNPRSGKRLLLPEGWPKGVYPLRKS